MILSYKPIGLTPLEHLKELIKEGKLENGKNCYAGRLDPMAHGLMIYLSNSNCKNVKNFLELSKTYKFKISLGVSTDSYDILGKVNNTCNNLPTIENCISCIKKYQGKIIQSYPKFSSINVNGKPLWKHSLDGTINDIKIPEKEINISKMKILNHKEIDFEDFKENILYRLNLLKSKSFRNNEIINSWNNINITKIYVIECEADVSSGTYIRSLCNMIGNDLNCGGIAYDILRIKIGNYNL